MNSSAPSDPEVPIAYAFGDFRLDLRRRVLLRAGRRVSTTPRVLDTLIHLVQHRGTLLARDTLMDSIWPDADVEPNNLSQNIVKLRRLFEERPRENRFIETVPGRGYRFIADVRIETAPLGMPSEPGDMPRDDQSLQLFRQALRLLQRPTVENCRGAVERLETALEIDPNFPLGWAGLANAHLLSANVGLATPVLLEQAERHAEHALEIEPGTAHAHAVIGMVCVLRGDWLTAESHFKEAVSLDATHPWRPACTQASCCNSSATPGERSRSCVRCPRWRPTTRSCS